MQRTGRHYSRVSSSSGIVYHVETNTQRASSAPLADPVCRIRTLRSRACVKGSFLPSPISGDRHQPV